MPKAAISWLVVFMSFRVLYVFNISGWPMHDEGTDFYEVWQLQQGKRSSVDYIAEQQPLFLMAGSLFVELWWSTKR